MKILQGQAARDCREMFINKFVDQYSTYYKERILNPVLKFEDSAYYGYLWECFSSCEVKTQKECMQWLADKTQIFILWDILPDLAVAGGRDAWNYPKHGVLSVDIQEYTAIAADLPEDIYLFDASFSWCVSFTHETNLQNERWCLLAKNNSFGM